MRRNRAEMHQLLFGIWCETRQAMLFVTHDIEEALNIAHRIVVLSGRPATVIEEYAIMACMDEAQRGKVRQEIKSMLQMEESA